MDISQQLILLFIGLVIGLFMGIIVGILIEKNRGADKDEPSSSELSDVQYGTVTPEQIHTLAEEDEGSSLNKLCSICGHENPADNIFCYDCGARL